MRAKQQNEKVAARYEGLTTLDGEWNGYVRINFDAIEKAAMIQKPQVYAVWNDMFHEGLSLSEVASAYLKMSYIKQHIFIVLTKRAELMQEQVSFFINTQLVKEIPENIILGVTCENQKRADERVPCLIQTPAAARVISYEPALGPLNMKGLWDVCPKCGSWEIYQPRGEGLYCDDCGIDIDKPKIAIDGVYCGGESGPGARPSHPDWMRSARDQCQAAGVKFLFKQWGEWLPQKEWLKQEISPDTERKWVRVDGRRMYRVGKKAAGRLLDGRRWDELPEVITCNQAL